MYSSHGESVLFYEDASHPNRHRHPALVAVPMSPSSYSQCPAYFTQALNTAESEWATHRPIIRTDDPKLGKWGFRKRIAKEAPYFHVWFGLEGGMGHVVEDEERWGDGEVWVRSLLGGMLKVGREVWGKMGRWSGHDGRVEGFRKRWGKFDWTKVLEGEQG
jgi:CWF19-like protein 2